MCFGAASAILPSGGLKVRGGKSSQPWRPVSLWCTLMHSSSDLSFSEEKMRPGGRLFCHPATPVTLQWPSLSSSSSASVAFVTTNCTPSTVPFARALLLILCPHFLWYYFQLRVICLPHKYGHSRLFPQTFLLPSLMSVPPPQG